MKTSSQTSRITRRSDRQPLAVLAFLGLVVMAGRATVADDVAAPPFQPMLKAELDRMIPKPLLGIDAAEDWKAQRPQLRRRLRTMMGIEPLPDRADLKAEVRGTVEGDGFVVEKILFQSSPGLYVTANLYRPKKVEGKLPAILYVCGHGKVEQNGVIYGNKAAYRHHGAWFGANGYVCLVVDTLQLGELAGLHHGTFREGMWWWQARGYTPAGIEAWNGMRAIDYLLSRPEVDPDRIGVTGRSGGGATSWWMAALDDRVKVAVPVAGITDMRDHVLNPWQKYDCGVIEGHCDCMFFVNIDRWDFDTLAALAAPKFLLVQNTDADPIFPEPGVRRIFEQMERVYGWYDARDRLDILIGAGGHKDTSELRHAAFAFFETHLKGKPTTADQIEEPERSLPIESLRVLNKGEVPADCRNATIHETFTPKAAEVKVALRLPEPWLWQREAWLQSLQSEVLGGWPEDDQAGSTHAQVTRKEQRDGWTVETIAYESAPGVPLNIWLLRKSDQDNSALRVLIPTAEEWSEIGPALTDAAEPLPSQLSKSDSPRAVIAVRGIGPTSIDPERVTHLKRRYALLGQTLDGMRAWDVRRGLKALTDINPSTTRQGATLVGRGDAAGWALMAGLFEPNVSAFELAELPRHSEGGPTFLNLDRLLGWPQLVALAAPRPVVITGDPSEWSLPASLAGANHAPASWFTVKPFRSDGGK
jgi:dienelactone hydrolase